LNHLGKIRFGGRTDNMEIHRESGERRWHEQCGFRQNARWDGAGEGVEGDCLSDCHEEFSLAVDHRVNGETLRVPVCFGNLKKMMDFYGMDMWGGWVQLKVVIIPGRDGSASRSKDLGARCI